MTISEVFDQKDVAPVNGAVSLKLSQVEKRYPGTPEPSVKKVNLEVRQGEFVALLGPSGCGKTTMLRMIAGLVSPSMGEIHLDGRHLNGVPPHQRNIGLVFQNYALFPLMTVFDNVAYGLRERRVASSDIKRRVEEALGMVHLGHLGHRRPKELSGGQQQRVALARALLINPSLLLLDEPLSNLDAKLRDSVRREIRMLQKRLNVTTVMVTHDQDEALSTADTIVVMNNGTVEQVGSPQEIYDRPATPFVANFVGACNVLPAVDLSRDGRQLHCRLENSQVRFTFENEGNSAAGSGHLIVRPENLRLADDDGAPDALRGEIIDKDFRGATTVYEVLLDAGHKIMANISNSVTQSHSVGSRVIVTGDVAAWKFLGAAA